MFNFFFLGKIGEFLRAKFPNLKNIIGEFYYRKLRFFLDFSKITIFGQHCDLNIFDQNFDFFYGNFNFYQNFDF